MSVEHVHRCLQSVSGMRKGSHARTLFGSSDIAAITASLHAITTGIGPVMLLLLLRSHLEGSIMHG